METIYRCLHAIIQKLSNSLKYSFLVFIFPLGLTAQNISYPFQDPKLDAETRADDLIQLTYKGWPLYYFGQDAETRGNTKGVSFPAPGVWPIVNKLTNSAPDGKALAEAYFNDNLNP